MNVLEKLSELQARRFDVEASKEMSTVADVERALEAQLPDGLKAALSHYCYAIDFDVTVSFRPIEPSGWERQDGAIDFNMIYGLAHDDWAILKMNETFAAQIPASCIVIGACSGGNQICLEKESGRILFWDHESSGAGVSLAANSFDDFMDSLFVVDDSLDDSDDGIIECDLRF